MVLGLCEKGTMPFGALQEPHKAQVKGGAGGCHNSAGLGHVGAGGEGGRGFTWLLPRPTRSVYLPILGHVSTPWVTF
jgi:hypothetical protein